MPVTDPESLFVHELKDILFAERTLEKALPKLANEATNPELKAAIQHHHEETKGHIANLAQIFDSMGMTDRGQACPGILGLIKEHDEFVEENGDAPGEVLDSFLCGAAARTEHYEIAAYTGLVTSANALGKPEAARLLRANLEQEKAMLATATATHEKIASGSPASR